MKEAKRNASDQTTVTEMKNGFDGAIRLRTPEGRIFELEDISVETSKLKSKVKKRLKKTGQNNQKV